MSTDIPKLSTRGKEAASPNNKMLILEVINNLWDPKSNPDGFVSLGVAENVSQSK
jgi:hypothetical protein